jgi:hypothetical protein
MRQRVAGWVLLAVMLGLSARVIWLDLAVLPVVEAGPRMATDFFLARAVGSPAAAVALRDRLEHVPADQTVVAVLAGAQDDLTVPYTARYLTWPGQFIVLECASAAAAVSVPPASLILGTGAVSVALDGQPLDLATLPLGITSPSDRPVDLRCSASG